jgi:hypothetical protein
MFWYWVLSALALWIIDLPSGVSPLITPPQCTLIEYSLLSVPLIYILLTMIFSVPRMIPSLQTTPAVVLDVSTAFSAYSI